MLRSPYKLKSRGLMTLVLIVAPGVLVGCSDAERSRRPNIVCVLVDTLRADHLGCYGYERDTSPRIDEIADEGLTFTRYFAASSWTNPSIATLFTGLYPQAVFPPAPHRKAIDLILPSKLDTLAECLQAGGYRTFGIVDHPGIDPKHGYAQGFEDYALLSSKLGWHHWTGTAPDLVLEEFRVAIDSLEADPFFLYVHLVYPHQPYTPLPPFEGMFGPGFSTLVKAKRQAVINSYDAEIRMTDDLVGKMHDLLGDRGLLDDSYFILTSDHGEGFWEHGLSEHGNSLFNELLAVPLVISPPRATSYSSGVVDNLQGSVDLFPTILDMAGVSIPRHCSGESLLPYFHGSKSLATGRKVFSESPHSRMIHGLSCQTEDRKLIFSPGEVIDDPDVFEKLSSEEHVMSFDLKGDPREQRDRGPGDSGWRAALGRALVDRKSRSDDHRRAVGNEKSPVNEETIRQLEALGYTGEE